MKVYCGIDLHAKVSQVAIIDDQGRHKKEGNAHLKAAWTQAATHAARTDPKVRRVYDRAKQRHSGRGATPIATNVIGHKLALAAYHGLKDGTDYQGRLPFGN